jgi:hypothetical protein
MINEAYNLIIELNKKSGNDIVILNFNPLRKHIRLLTRGIFSGINNHYY